MFRRLGSCILAAILLACAPVSWAFGQGERAITLENGWARKSPTDKSTINVYLDVTNRSENDDELVSIWTPVAESIMVEKPHWRGLKMSLDRVHTVEIAAGERIQFRPGNYQITLAHLTKAVPPGQSIPLELRFRNAGRMEFSVLVSNKSIVSKPKPEEKAGK